MRPRHRSSPVGAGASPAPTVHGGTKMAYDPERHHRRSIRLKSYQYAAGAYCVTICTHQRQMMFGQIYDGVMAVNEMGSIAHDEWAAIPSRFPGIELDEFVVMPNHLHGILFIKSGVPQAGVDAGPSLGAVVGAFKSLSTRAISRHLEQEVCRVWQRNYFEQIIRSDSMLEALRQYILNNPCQWQGDPDNVTP